MAHQKSKFQSRAREGFQIIYDSFQRAKNVAQLTEAVQAAVPLIQQYGLDKYQQQRLEELGMNRFNKIEEDMIRMSKVQRYNISKG